VPSDQKDEELQADFEEDENVLTDDIEDSETECSLPVSGASPPSPEADPEPHPQSASENGRYPKRDNRGWNSLIFGFHKKSSKKICPLWREERQSTMSFRT
jgi:hypothetical protein